MNTRRAFLASASGLALAAFAGPLRAESGALGPDSLPAGTLGASELSALPGKAPLIKKTWRPPNFETPVSYLREAFTPNDAFFVRYHVAAVPEIAAHQWRLEVAGDALDKPHTFTLGQLRSEFESVEVNALCQCSGNRRGLFDPHVPGVQWGYGAMGNARWRGVRLRDVLVRAGLSKTAVEIVLDGADGAVLPATPDFVKSIPAWKAMDENTLLAYEMNGEPLSPDHGAPFRIIVPHWYAVASVKWLKRIDVLTEPYTGEFQTGHYMYEWPDRPHESVDLMRVRARITDPAPASTINVGTRTVRGKAWSGAGPVTRVDVSLTGEGDWHAAQLEPPKGPYQWQDWSFDWEATDVGRHTLRARATDAAGNVQPEVPPWNRLGYGNNAIEVSYVDVR